MTKFDKMMELHYATEQAKRNSDYYQRLKRESNDLKKEQRDYFDKEIKYFDEIITENKKRINGLIKISCPKVEKISFNSQDGYYSVYIVDKRAKFGAWMDVAYCEDEEAYTAEWNQYIFYTSDEKDIYQKLHQEDDECFEKFYWAAVYAIEGQRRAA